MEEVSTLCPVVVGGRARFTVSGILYTSLAVKYEFVAEQKLSNSP